MILTWVFVQGVGALGGDGDGVADVAAPIPMPTPIALELCPASLEDIITRPHAFPEITAMFKPKRALAEVAAGLGHLHSLGIVRWDINPQNILVSHVGGDGRRMLISNYGRCKKLGNDETSLLPTGHGHHDAGMVGWHAPEILRGEVSLNAFAEDDAGEEGGIATSSAIAITDGTRPTKSVDIFALGCLFFYILTSGEHPYGEGLEREQNILKDIKDLSALGNFGDGGEEAKDLIGGMLDSDPKAR